ncbi:sensor histidine kinase [Paenibacillus sp. MMS18-CY102]|uniref:sensor histidine kinase n=1 Tax=Paenibacillus sp. MMS18-CY102 TaxID=2682849 RepID=UPI0013654B7F|nr:HAMP domain-containing sensor histidine kinase [Paenibacillus sp. MMS18-CY102]MWC30792.1 HAMP domain-containing protein [Paenibacillus sp. MMS18-CY102]
MNARSLFAIAAAVCAVGLILFMLVGRAKVDTDVDVIMVNEIVKITEGHWAHLEPSDYGGIRLPFVIVDAAGKPVYETSAGLFTTMNDAVKHNSTIVDIIIDRQIAGKAIVMNDYKQAIESIMDRLTWAVGIAFVLLAAMCGFYTVWLNQAIFRPFKRLQSFAAHVARGNLDIPLHMGKNNPFGAFTESFDLMRDQLAAARQSEYEANRSKKELVASLSHDIKTPVASIKAVSELMLVKAEDDKTTRQLKTIYSKAEQIHLLITDMFHATMEEMTELTVTVSEQSSGMLQEMFMNADYEGRVHCEPIPPCLVLMDADRLQQVVDNVISNAYKYASTAVTIRSECKDGHLAVSIMDYGPGVDADELPLLFNKFYRGTNVQGQSGTGLGLFISRYFMKNMQGEMECYSRSDGFTVVLRLMLAG